MIAFLTNELDICSQDLKRILGFKLLYISLAPNEFHLKNCVFTMLELTQWIAERYLCGWGQVLQTVVPAGVKNKAGTRLVTELSLAPDIDNQLAIRKQLSICHLAAGVW